MEIKTAAVIGAGAIGSYFIAGLSPKLKDGLWIVAEGERKHRLSENGITVNDRKIPLHVKTPEEAKGADLVLVTVKYGALEAALPMIEKIVDSHTIVLSPMNGVDSEKVIGERIGMEHMVYSMIKIASERKEDRIFYNPETTQGIFFGEKDGQESERIKALSELFSGTQVHYHVCDNIEQDIWYKYALNISKNLPQAIINCGLGAYNDSQHVAYISKRLREEVVQVAAALGIDISDENNISGKSATFSPEARFSTLQDLDAKRPTEIDMFSGTLIRMGKELSVETPFNEFAYHAIKALEEKNRGVIK